MSSRPLSSLLSTVIGYWRGSNQNPMDHPLAWLDEIARSWSEKGLDRHFRAVSGSSSGRVSVFGRSLINFASNDYLGLAADPRVVEAAIEATRLHGWGSGASPLVSGWREPHEALASALAKFEGTEAVALFPSGFTANLGTIGALAGPGDVVYLDRLNHSSLIEGARASRAKLRVYPHADVNRLEAILTRDRGRFRRSLIATDGVFSMDGDIAPLAGLSDLSSRFDTMLLVDEAHGTGVFGSGGRGASEACGVHDRLHVIIGTLSKSLGSIGGFVTGSRSLIDWLINHARPLIYSTSLPAAAAAAASRALEIMQAETWRRTKLLDLSGKLRSGLGSAALSGIGPIVPWIVETPQGAMARSGMLLDRGFLIPAIRPPTVPEGTARLRISLSAAHEADDIERLLEAIREIGA